MDGAILAIDRGGGQPVGVQLVDGLRRGILGGRLRPGDTVPSTRALASELGVSRSAVVASESPAEGFRCTGGSWKSDNACVPPPAACQSPLTGSIVIVK